MADEDRDDEPIPVPDGKLFWYSVPRPIPEDAVDGRYLPLHPGNLSPSFPSPATGYCYWYDYANTWRSGEFRVVPVGTRPGEKGLRFSGLGLVRGERMRLTAYAAALGLASPDMWAGGWWELDTVPVALTPDAVASWAGYVRCMSQTNPDPLKMPPIVKPYDALIACRAVAIATKAPTAPQTFAPVPLSGPSIQAEIALHCFHFRAALGPVRVLSDEQVDARVDAELDALIVAGLAVLPDGYAPPAVDPATAAGPPESHQGRPPEVVDLTVAVEAAGLKGKELKTARQIARGNGVCPLADLASMNEWPNPLDNWNSMRGRINGKLRPSCWTLGTVDGNAVARQNVSGRNRPEKDQ